LYQLQQNNLLLLLLTLNADKHTNVHMNK